VGTVSFPRFEEEEIMERAEQDAMQAELAALRTELEELRTERDVAPRDAIDEDDNGEGNRDLKTELRELAQLVDHELKDTSTITLIVVFALGAFVGRILPR
jgi:hypothetical protein